MLKPMVRPAATNGTSEQARSKAVDTLQLAAAQLGLSRSLTAAPAPASKAATPAAKATSPAAACEWT